MTDSPTSSDSPPSSAPSDGPAPADRRGLAPVLALVLFLATCGLYLPVRDHLFVNYDDPIYVTENEAVLGGLSAEGITWAFTEVHSANYHPLTWLSHMLDVELFERDAGGHHLTSLLLHGLNAALLLLVLAAATRRPWPSAIAAALFALHPLRVESVAWVSERKDVLSGTFFLLTLLSYVAWTRRPSSGRYTLVALCLAGGLLAKQMLVTTPFVLLLLDAWPLGRWRAISSDAPGARSLTALLREKLPLFALIVLAAAVAVVAQRTGGTVAPLASLALDVRLANAVAAVGAYLQQGFWPAGLASFYPHAVIAAAEPWKALLGPALVGGIALVVVTAVAVRRRRSAPYLMVGWFWFLGMLAPVVGLVQIGAQSHADRYTYLPWIGIVIALVFGIAEWLRSRPGLRAPAVGAAAAALVALGFLSSRQIRTWHDSQDLALRALAVTENNWVAHNNLGMVEMESGDLTRAEGSFRAALAILPQMREARFNLATALEKQGRMTEAEAEYRTLLGYHRRDPLGLRRLAALKERTGDRAGAIASLQEASEAAPDDPATWLALARMQIEEEAFGEAEVAIQRAADQDAHRVEVLLLRGSLAEKQGDLRTAYEAYVQAVEIDDEDAHAHGKLGRILARVQEIEQARTHLERAILLDDVLVEPRVDLARVHIMTADPEAAERWLDEALGIEPNHAEANDTLGFLLMEQQRFDEARACFERALETNPRNVAAVHNLGVFYEQIEKDSRAAAAQYRRALELDIASETAPESARALAWILATTSDGELRDGNDAVRWATFALDSSGPEDAQAWEVVAAARAAADDQAGAVEAQNRALELMAGTPREPTLRQHLARFEAGGALYLSP